MESDMQFIVVLIMITTILSLFFFLLVFLGNYCLYNSTQERKIATINTTRVSDLPPAYKDLYKL